MDQKTLDKLHTIQIEILDQIVKVCELNNLNYCLIGGTLLGAVRHKGFIPWDDDLDIAMPRDDYNKFIDICERQMITDYEIDYYTTNKYYCFPFMKIRKKGTIYEEKYQENKNIPKGIWVDIFVLDNANDEKNLLQTFQAKWVRRIRNNIINRMGGTEIHKTVRNSFLNSLLNRIETTQLCKVQQSIMAINRKQSSKYYINLGSNYNYIKQTIPKDKYFPSVKVEFEGKFYNAPRNSDYILKRIYGDYMKLPPEDKRVTHNPVRLKFEGEDEIIF